MKPRNTIQQKLVREILSNAEHALSVDDILTRMPQKIDKTTAYRILERFRDSGKAHCITDEHGKSHYALCDDCDSGHHCLEHLHFECRQCHKLECISETVKIPILKNYQVEETQLLLIGLCDDCRVSA